MPINSSGITTHRDHFVLDMDKNILEQRVRRFFDVRIPDETIRREMELKDNRDWQLATARYSVKFDENNFKICAYRPFDVRSIYYHSSVIDFDRNAVMQHFLAGENVGLLIPKQSTDGIGALFVNTMAGHKSFTAYDRNFLFPLYLYPSENDLDQTRRINFDPKIYAAICKAAGLFPSPLAGEGGSTRSGETGEGFFLSNHPSSGSSSHLLPQGEKGNSPLPSASLTPSPTGGEGGISSGGEGYRAKEREQAKHSLLLERARDMRKEPTEAERKLWQILRGRRFSGFKFRRQVPIGDYIADFVCHEAKLIVEADGSQHADNDYDKMRDAWFAAQGYRVTRFWNHEILHQTRVIEDTIWRDVNTPLFSPSSVPSGSLLPQGEKGASQQGEDKKPPELQVFDYIYGVLHCPAYRETYAQFLKIDFPRIPYPSSPDSFADISAKGEQLRRLHLMEPAAIGDTPYPFKGDGDCTVEKPYFEASKVFINKAQYFEGVTLLAWEFYIGGYQPAQKWLKDRKGRQLSFEDVKHYQRIIKILSETHRIMQTIILPLEI